MVWEFPNRFALAIKEPLKVGILPSNVYLFQKPFCMFTTLISATDLSKHSHRPDWVIVDCRFSLHDPEKGRSDYREGHIPGAFYAHLDKDLSGAVLPGQTGRHPLPAVDRLTDLFRSWGVGRRTQVVAYDYRSGGIAARLWWLLNWLGHEEVAVLDGGWAAWQDGGFAVSGAIPPTRDGHFEPHPDHRLVVEAEQVGAIPDQGKGCLVDSREAVRYLGEEEPIDPVAGHIPGAVNAPFMENVDEEGRFLPAGALRERFLKILSGAQPEESVFYCGSGVTACHNLLAMKYAGLGMARLYPGSWSEWITDPERKVAK